MSRIKYLIILLLLSSAGKSQQSYKDSLETFIKNYVEKHEVVTGEDKKKMHFFPVNETYKVVARFEKVRSGSWFTMETSNNKKQTYRVYGIIHFTINDTTLKLNIYQSQRLMTVPEFKDHLFLPFYDLTSGEETYVTGRYIDLNFNDILDNKIVIDFNKAYNPYCAYVSNTYNCPIPPRENSLNVAIRAGEKSYQK